MKGTTLSELVDMNVPFSSEILCVCLHEQLFRTILPRQENYKKIDTSSSGRRSFFLATRLKFQKFLQKSEFVRKSISSKVGFNLKGLNFYNIALKFSECLHELVLKLFLNRKNFVKFYPFEERFNVCCFFSMRCRTKTSKALSP